MHAMNTDQQTYYSNPTGPHQGTGGYYIANGVDQQYQMRNPNTFTQPRMGHQYFNVQGSNNYVPQPIYVQSYQASPFIQASGPRGMNPQYIIRPPNEVSNGTQAFIPQAGYSFPNTNLQQPPNMYTPQASYYPYPVPQLSNQSQISQPQYVASKTQPQSQSPQTSQQLTNDQQHGVPNQPTQQQEKRQRKPLTIVDPKSHEAVIVGTDQSSANVSSTAAAAATTTVDDNLQKDSIPNSTVTNPKPVDEVNKTLIQADFRKKVAELLNSNAQTDKNANHSSPEEQTNATSTKEKQAENIALQSASSTSSSRSGSISRTKSPTPTESTSNKSSDKPQPGHPGIRTRSITEEKSSQDDTKDNKSDETVSIISKPTSDDTINNESSSKEETATKSESTSSLSTEDSIECVTAPQTPTQSNTFESEPTSNEKTSSTPTRRSYSIQELLTKRSAVSAQKRPVGLKSIDGVTNPPVQRQSSVKNNHNNNNRGSNIQIEQPELHNRVEDPYKLTDKKNLDSNDKFLREVTAILNKLTPQTYEKLLQQLDKLELNSAERLEGMINVIFSKAVIEKSFCNQYAKLCKDFQRKQVTVPGEDGQPVTHFFRQKLLTRCQNGFEGDYRQEIDYSKRKAEVDVITDEKTRKEEDEQLAEDLHKAKQRKFGNIFFIGELFKLNLLIDTIMYECIKYLLQDKTDEESLESLCRLLNTIGEELDAKPPEKNPNRKALEKCYAELDAIFSSRHTSARIRFMIQDLMELRKANWVARRVEAKPTTIDEIHEQERIKREQQERDQERDRQQRREQNRGGPQQYTESRGGSRGSGVKQQSKRIDDERSDRPFTVNSVRQLQSNDKRNQGPIALNLAPQGAWSKGSSIDKKSEDDRSNAARSGKPPTGSAQSFRPKTGASPGTPGYAVQRQPSRELARGNSLRDRENAMESLRKTTAGNVVTSPNNATNSREGSRNVSREQSRNASRESSVNERICNPNITESETKASTQTTTANDTSFDEEKVKARVHSLIEEYTENYSDNNDRPVKEAVEDLVDFCPPNTDHQAIIVQELFTNVLEAKSRARKAVGHLLDVALDKNIISNEGFVSGFKLIIEAAPDYAVDIPLIWQYIGEIVGALIGAPTSKMVLLKPILQSIPDEKSKQFFQYIIRYAVEFSSKSHIQRYWQSSGFSLNDLLKSDSVDSSFTNEYNWLSDPVAAEPISPPIKENLSPRADLQLVKLFKSFNDQGTKINDAEIIAYIHKNMVPKEKFYIRNIVLSYLEACLINREPQKKIQEDIAKTRTAILNAIIEHNPEAEVQAVYAVQNFVHKLEHPPKMAQLLFDIFYDEECVSEDAFFEWRKNADPSETEGHSVVEMSTQDFFKWLQQADTEVEGEGEES